MNRWAALTKVEKIERYWTCAFIYSITIETLSRSKQQQGIMKDTLYNHCRHTRARTRLSNRCVHRHGSVLIACSNQLFQLLGVHPWIPRHDPALEWNRTSVPIINATPVRRLLSITYAATPLVNLASMCIPTPFSSRGFSILNTTRNLSITFHTERSAKFFPTHIRRPNPNVMLSVVLGRRELSLLRNRSGVNNSGLGYLDSSCAIDLAKQVVRYGFQLTLKCYQPQVR